MSLFKRGARRPEIQPPADSEPRRDIQPSEAAKNVVESLRLGAMKYITCPNCREKIYMDSEDAMAAAIGAFRAAQPQRTESEIIADLICDLMNVLDQQEEYVEAMTDSSGDVSSITGETFSITFDMREDSPKWRVGPGRANGTPTEGD